LSIDSATAPADSIRLVAQIRFVDLGETSLTSANRSPIQPNRSEQDWTPQSQAHPATSSHLGQETIEICVHKVRPFLTVEVSHAISPNVLSLASPSIWTSRRPCVVSKPNANAWAKRSKPVGVVQIVRRLALMCIRTRRSPSRNETWAWALCREQSRGKRIRLDYFEVACPSMVSR